MHDAPVAFDREAVVNHEKEIRKHRGLIIIINKFSMRKAPKM
jgi:hypothetical protein